MAGNRWEDVVSKEVPVVGGGGEPEEVGDVGEAVKVASKAELEDVSVEGEGEPLGDSEGVPNGVVAAEELGDGVAHAAVDGPGVGDAKTRAGSLTSGSGTGTGSGTAGAFSRGCRV